MQLLKITTIPLEYDLNIQNAKLTAPQIEPAKLSQHTTPAAINLQTENAKVRMDSSAMRRSMGMKSIADVSKEAPVKTQETANKVTSHYVNMGNSMVKPGMTIAQFMKQKSLSNITIDTNIGAIPTEKIDMSWEPAISKISVRRSKVDLDWKKSAREMEFIPSSITLEIKQLADVKIEYLGGFNYVPPSSDPEYEEK